MKAKIQRVQFTRYDREELHPECANEKYLEYEMLGTQSISYGYQILWENGNYFWIPLFVKDYLLSLRDEVEELFTKRLPDPMTEEERDKYHCEGSILHWGEKLKEDILSLIISK